MNFYRRLPILEYLKCTNLEEVLFFLNDNGDTCKILAGGTDLIPKLKRREIKIPKYVVDIKNIASLRYIHYQEGKGLSLGSLTTMAEIEGSSLMKNRFKALFEGASSIGSVQVRNRATIGGNICNAVPSGDTLAPLLVYSADLRLLSKSGERWVKMEEFFLGPKDTVLRKDEILSEIYLPDPPLKAKSTYLKLSPRNSMDLATVGVACLLELKDGVLSNVRIALAACAPTPIRTKKAEQLLEGKRFSEEIIVEASEMAADESKPITDHRASKWYRKEMVKLLVKRALFSLISEV